MKRKYVATSIEEFLNESKTLTLKRSYGGKAPVVVSAKAPIRNQVLSFVSESEGKVSRREIKRFIAGLNETNKSPNAAANVWLKRNAKFFEVFESNGETYYKLSKIGKRLITQIKPVAISESKVFEQVKKEDEGDHDFVDTKKGYERKGIYDKANEGEEEDDKVEEGKKDEKSIKELLEAIKAKREKMKLNEEEEEDKGGDDEGAEEGGDDDGGDDAGELDFDDELSFDDLNLDGEGDDEAAEETDPEGGEDAEGDDLGDDAGEVEGDDDDTDKVEIVEFTIKVDDVDEAIEELKEKGVTATPAEESDSEILVSAEDAEDLIDWLESKGVDVEEMFGGSIEIEGEDVEGEGDDLEIEGEGDELEGEEFSFSLDGEGDDEGGEEAAEDVEDAEKVDGEEDEGGEEDKDKEDDDDVDESVTGMEKEEKEGTPNLTK